MFNYSIMISFPYFWTIVTSVYYESNPLYVKNYNFNNYIVINTSSSLEHSNKVSG